MILVWALSTFTYFFVIYKGFVQFGLWGQVVDFAEHVTMGGGLTLDLITHVHFLRFLIVSPSFFLAENFGFDPDRTFSFQFGLFISLIPFILYFYRPFEIRKQYKWLFISFFFIVYALLSLKMNGRIGFAHAGFAIAIATLHGWDQKRIGRGKFFLFYFVGMFLCSVSTGTIFMPPFLLLIYFVTHFILKIKKRGFTRFDFYTLGFVFMLILASSPYFYVQIEKNLSYYGGSVINMLEHGLGRVFLKLLSFLPFIILILLGMSGIFAFFAMRYKFNVIIIMAMTVTAFGGLFGGSTLTLIFLPILILFYENMEKALDFFMKKRLKPHFHKE